jgi:hypothetical protein
MSNATETKRPVGRPQSFPGQATKMAGFNLPVETLALLAEAAKSREVTQNTLVERALRSYLRNR